MRVLAIETATGDVAAGIGDESGPLACATVRSRRRHAELLHPLVGQVCELAGVTLVDIDAIGVDVGPGLFTGIRVGVAAAKGWAISLGIPIVTLTSLDILRAACEAVPARPGCAVIPVVDLKRGEIAWSLPEKEMEHGPPEKLAAVISGMEAPVVLAGDGALRHAALLGAGDGDDPTGGAGAGPFSPNGRAARPRMLAGVELASPPVASLAMLAVAGAREGRGVDPLDVLPVYLREADARINWTTRHDGPAIGVPGAGGP